MTGPGHGNGQPRSETMEEHSVEPVPLDAEKRKRFIRGVRETVGEVALLMASSGTHRYHYVQDLNWMVFPAVALSQYKLVRNGKDETVGFISWALVSDEVLQRIRNGAVKLRPEDWKSGDSAVVMDAVGSVEPGRLLQALKGEVFPHRRLVSIVHGDEGGIELKEIEPEDSVKMKGKAGT